MTTEKRTCVVIGVKDRGLSFLKAYNYDTHKHEAQKKWWDLLDTEDGAWIMTKEAFYEMLHKEYIHNPDEEE